MLSQILQWFDDKIDAAIFASLGYSSVYLIQSGDDDAYRVAVSAKVPDEMRRAQQHNWKPLRVVGIGWFPDASVARRVAAQIRKDHSDRELNSEWFRSGPETGSMAIRSAAIAVRVPFTSHQQMLEMVQRVRQSRTDRVFRDTLPGVA